MRPETPALIWDAKCAADAILRFVDGMVRSEFNDDLLVRSAVERQFEILGESLNRLRSSDPGAAAEIPDIHRIIAMRNVIAHEYGEIDYSILWAVITTRLEDLRSRLDELLRKHGG